MMLIVIPPKRIDLLLRIVDRREPMHVQTFLAESAIERFDGCIVRRLASTTKVKDHTIGVRPQVHRCADELGAVVAVDSLRQSAFEAQPLERGDDIATAESLADVYRQTFPREEIEDGQRSEASSIGELVGDKVHTPDVIACRRWSTLLPMHSGRMAPGPLSPQRQSLLGVEPIAAFLAE